MLSLARLGLGLVCRFVGLSDDCFAGLRFNGLRFDGLSAMSDLDPDLAVGDCVRDGDPSCDCDCSRDRECKRGRGEPKALVTVCLTGDRGGR